MFNQKAMQFLDIIAFCCMMVILTETNVEAINQNTTLVSDSAAPAGEVYVNAQYDCSDNTVTTLGIRIHFDSAKLTYDGHDNLLSADILAPPQLQDDVDNRDAHADTDKLILIGWQDMAGNWPNQTLPVNLVRLKFTPTGSGGTRLNITRVTNAVGFGFSGTGLSLSEPSVTTATASSISQTTAAAGGTVTSDGGAPVTARGVCWSTSQNPTVSNSKTVNGTGTGSFSSTVSGLFANTTYYVRAYATNSLGTGYGNQISFTTDKGISIPTVTTRSASAITKTGATSGGSVISDGGAAVTARGVCWNTTGNPTVSNSKTTDGSGTGSYTSTITGLSPGGTYYVRAYAINSVGTGYGSQVSFTTTSSYTISGYVKSASTGYGISGVTLSFSNNAGSAVTNSSGYYSKTINAGWSGTVTPSIQGYTFSPVNRAYSSISSSQFNQDFSATRITFSISGYVRNGNNLGISGASIRFSNNSGTATTGSNGYYYKEVPHGWSGTATPEKDGYTFTPTSRSYPSVTSSQTAQNYTGTPTAEPNIAVSPSSLVFNQPDNPRSARNVPQISIESRENEPFIPIDGQYATGLVIPDHVKEYWETHTPTRKYRSRRNLPSSWDWSIYDSPVRNQTTRCGSCWAFAATALIENLVNQDNLTIENNFAEQVLVSCLYNGRGCSGGWYWTAFNYIHQEGIPPESCYPYTATNGSCDRQCPTPDFKAKISSFTPANGLWGKSGFNVDDLKGALQDGPLCVAMEVPNSFYGYSGGVYRYTGGYYEFGHAVLLVGYNDTERYFNVKNSWGTWWGEGGYFRISYDDVSSVVKFGSYAATASDIFIEGDSGEIQEVAITNTGTADLTVSSISVDRSWLNVTPTSFSTISPDEVKKISVSVSDWNAVVPPEDVGTITLSSNDPDTPSVEIEVTAMISVMTNRPELSISPPFYAETSTNDGVLTIHVDNSAGETYLDIANYGDGEMAWTASTSDSWLSISEGSAGTNSGRVVIDYPVNTSTPRTGTVTVTADGASNSPRDVHINQTELDTDADDDGMPDYFELIYGFDSTNPDDALGDADGDGLNNLGEYETGTNPANPDSDGDCRMDGDEVDQGMDPLVSNPPALGLQDAVTILEVLTGTTPDLICSNTDADQNGKVEVNDVIFVMQDMAGLR